VSQKKVVDAKSFIWKQSKIAEIAEESPQKSSFKAVSIKEVWVEAIKDLPLKKTITLIPKPNFQASMSKTFIEKAPVGTGSESEKSQ